MSDNKYPNFWSKPEGKLGMVVAILLLLMFIYLVFINLAAITAFAFSTIQLGVVVLILTAILSIIVSPSLRVKFINGYKAIMTGVTGLLIAKDEQDIEEYDNEVLFSYSEIDSDIQNLITTKYKVIPFKASVSKTGTSNSVANQLQQTINSQTIDGWEYQGMKSISTFVAGSSGCFGFGSTAGYTTFVQVLVFAP
jgi:hypothetical protein